MVGLVAVSVMAVCELGRHQKKDRRYDGETYGKRRNFIKSQPPARIADGRASVVVSRACWKTAANSGVRSEML